MRRLILFAITAMLLVCASGYAHHSYAATYDTTKEIKLSGKLVQFSLKNPHSYVTIQAPDAKGNMQRWSIEWAGTSQLNSRGITNDTLKIGDQVNIVGRPSRVAGEFKALMVTLKRPSDGVSWGTSGEIVE